MPRLVDATAKYRCHKASGQAIVSIQGHDLWTPSHDIEIRTAAIDVRNRCAALTVGRLIGKSGSRSRLRRTTSGYRIRSDVRGHQELHRQLRARGFATVECPLSEFVKSGGSAKCLTLRLDGEDAAAWRE